MKLVLATAAHYKALFAIDPPDCWFGKTLIDERSRLIGMGLVWWGPDGRWWAGMELARDVGAPRVLVHRAALDALAFAREQGLVIHALCDESKPRARAWLNRLGFTMTDERLPQGVVWTR